jgi:hypothetical protein
MNILLSEPGVKEYFNAYCDFLNVVFRFQVYCTMSLGKERQDYVEWIEALRNHHSELINGLSFEGNRIFHGVIMRLDDMLSSGSQAGVIGKGCEEIVRKFVYVDETQFRRGYLEACAVRLAQKEYSQELIITVLPTLKSGSYDAAVVAAFKCLDAHLQKILGLPSTEYGESLINQAFSPNFASGANALFRNAVAHRSVFEPSLSEAADAMAKAMASGVWPAGFHKLFYDRTTAQTAIVLVAMLMKAATKIAMESDLIDDETKKRIPFGSS